MRGGEAGVDAPMANVCEGIKRKRRSTDSRALAEVRWRLRTDGKRVWRSRSDGLALVRLDDLISVDGQRVVRVECQQDVGRERVDLVLHVTAAEVVQQCPLVQEHEGACR